MQQISAAWVAILIVGVLVLSTGITVLSAAPAQYAAMIGGLFILVAAVHHAAADPSG